MGSVVDQIVPELCIEIRKALIEDMTLRSELRKKRRSLFKVFFFVKLSVEKRNDRNGQWWWRRQSFNYPVHRQLAMQIAVNDFETWNSLNWYVQQITEKPSRYQNSANFRNSLQELRSINSRKTKLTRRWSQLEHNTAGQEDTLLIIPAP